MTQSRQRSSTMIDGFNLGLPRGTGVATYARNLSHAYQNLGLPVDVLYGFQGPGRHASRLLREVSFFDSEDRSSSWGRAMRMASWLRPRPFGISTREVSVSGQVITRPLAARLPAFDRLFNTPDLYNIADYQFAITGKFLTVRNPGGVRVMHWTYPMPLRLAGARNIYTLHDLVPLKLPYTTLDHKPRYLRLMQRIVAEADRIVTVSETSREDIIALLDCRSDKVVNTYQAVDLPRSLTEKTDEQVQAEVEGAFGLPFKGYFLFFGAIEPKKNIGRLVEAYLASNVTAPLALVGPTGWKADEELRLYQALKSQRLEDSAAPGPSGVDASHRRIVRFEFLPYSLLVSAIRGARATMFPSLYEGFGLPVLESMLLGTPVITSNLGSMAEIGGDAALLVDPYDCGAIAAAMRRLQADDQLCRDLAERGRRQAALFSTARYQERLASIHAGMDLDTYDAA